LYADRLRDSRGPVDAKALASAYEQDRPANEMTWVADKVGDLLGEKSIEVLKDLYREAGWVGIATGKSQIRQAARKSVDKAPSVDWDGWEPGDAEAAARLIGTSKAPGLKNLLDGANVTIKGIRETRYNDLAGVLARSVSEGLGVDETAKQIDAMFGVGGDWAEMVARTETARAVTAGTLDSYRDAGLSKVEWLTADGGCEICGEFESMGAVPMDDGFGDVEGPPAHPNCLCTLLPVVSDDVELGVVADLVKAGRNAIDIALEKLNKIPMVDDEHIAVPWPITKRPKLDPEVWADSSIQSVVIADLYATQKLLTKERVVFFIENPGAIELGRRAFANVYDLGERLVIVDGHHRLAALWLLGADAANVWFLEE